MSGKPSIGGALIILNALVWAAAMLVGAWLFADEPWSEGLYLWTIAGFSIANSFLLIALGRRSRC